MRRSCRMGFCSWAALVLSACAVNDASSEQRGDCPPDCGSPALMGDAAGMLSATGGDAAASPVADAGAQLPMQTLLADGGSTPRVDAAISLADASVPIEAGSEAGAVVSVDAAAASPDASAGAQSLPPATDYAKPGPFKTTTQANVGPSSNYTIFRPDPLGANGFVHAPIIFGPGILTDAGFYSAFLTHLASHGFVTISVNSMSGGPGDPGNLSAMKQGLDWLIAQNAQAGVYQGKLATERAVAMGYSIGATASVQLSSHKAVMTTVVIHGHNTQGDPHGPVLMITGTSDVIGDMRKTLGTLEEAPAVLVALPIGHLDVLDELAMLSMISARARYIAPITAWLRYWVNGDQAAKKFFSGSDCETCKSPWITPEPNAKWKALML
jgi:hypothetical protein